MDFYCGINERAWNGAPVTPGEHAVVSPVYGSKENKRRKNSVCVPAGTQVIQDSGAFCDGPGSRLTYEEAYQRQVKHAAEFGYTGLITHRASYDLLIDEKWKDGQRTKQRWGVEEAEEAVAVTVESARFMAEKEQQLGRVLSAQGVEAFQYLRCVKQITPLMREGDIFGLGGWCITGKMPAVMMPVFRQTMSVVIPFLAREGVERVHVWGVVYPQAVGELQHICDKYRVKPSTDSAGPSMNPAAFSRWGYGDWVDRTYQRPENPKERGPDRILHVSLTRQWLENIHLTKYYKPIEKGESHETVPTGSIVPVQYRYRQLNCDHLWA